MYKNMIMIRRFEHCRAGPLKALQQASSKIQSSHAQPTIAQRLQSLEEKAASATEEVKRLDKSVKSLETENQTLRSNAKAMKAKINAQEAKITVLEDRVGSLEQATGVMMDNAQTNANYAEHAGKVLGQKGFSAGMRSHQE